MTKYNDPAWKVYGPPQDPAAEWLATRAEELESMSLAEFMDDYESKYPDLIDKIRGIVEEVAMTDLETYIWASDGPDEDE